MPQENTNANITAAALQDLDTTNAQLTAAALQDRATQGHTQDPGEYGYDYQRTFTPPTEPYGSSSCSTTSNSTGYADNVRITTTGLWGDSAISGTSAGTSNTDVPENLINYLNELQTRIYNLEMRQQQDQERFRLLQQHMLEQQAHTALPYSRPFEQLQDLQDQPVIPTQYPADTLRYEAPTNNWTSADYSTASIGGPIRLRTEPEPTNEIEEEFFGRNNA